MLSRLIGTALILWCVRVAAAASDTLEAVRKAKSEEIRKYMNESSDPCESFYDFACGNWKTYYPATAAKPRSAAYNMAFTEYKDKFSQQLTTVTDFDTETERKVKNYYQSCMNCPNYTEKLREIVSEFGQMPVLEGATWQEDDFDWLKTVARISHKYGIHIILGLFIHADLYDHAATILRVTSPDFTLKNTTLIVDNLKNFLHIEEQMAENKAREIVDFENILAKASADANYMRKSSIEEMHRTLSPEFDVNKFFNISYGSIPTGKVIWLKPYVKSLFGIMTNTPQKVVANYVFYCLLVEFMPSNESELPERCIREIITKFVNVVSYMLYRTSDLQDAELEVEHMWQGVKTTLQMMLESSRLSWFDDRLRENALEKLHSVKLTLASFKEHNFKEEYDSLDIIDNEDYLENKKSLMAFSAAKTRASLYGMPLKNNHFTSPYYVRSANAIIIPLLVLQSDFFYSKSLPSVLNAARLGETLGHEVVHGFSGFSRNYNKLGDWRGKWDEDSEREYDERRQCLYDQYHNYTIGGRQSQQAHSQSENAADLVGLVLAYETYRRWYEDAGRTKEQLELEVLPNLDYTNNQLFFIYYAQKWCADINENGYAQLAKDTHSHPKLRAIVPLTNMDAFSQAFKCPLGTAMNPVKKCIIY